MSLFLTVWVQREGFLLQIHQTRGRCDTSAHDSGADRFFYFAYVSGERKQILLSARSTKQRPYPTFMSTNKLVPLLTYVIADVNRRSLTVLSLDYLRLSNSSRNLYRVINTISWLRNITHGCSVLLHVETLRIFLYIVSLSKAMDISVDVTLTGPTCHEEYSATRLLKVLAFSIQ